MSVRPRLKTTHRPLRRGDGSVQLGWGDAGGEPRGVVLDGLEGVEVAFLDLIDGTRRVDELVALAELVGIAPARTVELVDLLHRHGLIDATGPDAPDRADLRVLLRGASTVAPQTLDDLTMLLAAARRNSGGHGGGHGGAEMHAGGESTVPDVPGRPPLAALPSRPGAVVPDRATQHVLVTGRGPVTWEIARRLRSTGIGRVDAGPEATDATLQALVPGFRRLANPALVPSGRVGDPGADPPDLVVLVVPDVVTARDAIPWRSHGVGVLPVVVGQARIVVGPPVVHPDDPCLRCLDLVRADLDPAWPTLARQLAATESLSSPGELSAEGSLTAIACGVVGLLVAASLDPRGRAAAPSERGWTASGISVEMSLPWPRLDHRRWPRHPRCPTHPAAAHPAGASTPRTRDNEA